MAQKTPTAWKANPAKIAGVFYSSPITTYNSSTTAFSSSQSNLDEFNKLPTAWTLQTKRVTAWRVNPTAITNLYVYDSAAHIYDSAIDTYDGIVVGQDFSDIKIPTSWSPL